MHYAQLSYISTCVQYINDDKVLIMIQHTILVTGGAGYIGSHVCKALSNAGYQPVAFDNLSTGVRRAVKWGPLEEGDILDKVRLKEVIQKHSVVAVIHMAAFIDVGESVKHPAKYFQNNVVGGLRVIEAMQESKVKHIVFSSTAAVYGMPKTLPVTEKAETLPINPYGRSKLIVEGMLKDFETSDGITHVVLRYFNAAGADTECEIGCDQKKPNNLIPILMDVQQGRRATIEIFGNDYDTPDGTAQRDYIHVQDLAHAHVLALDALLAGKESLTLNLGTGSALSVNEVVASTERITKKKVPSTIAPRRAGDPAILVADPSLAKKKLGWEAKFNDIDSIVKTAWEWEKKRNI